MFVMLLFIIAIFVGKNWCIDVVFIGIFQVTNNFLSLLSVLTSHFVKIFFARIYILFNNKKW